MTAPRGKDRPDFVAVIEPALAHPQRIRGVPPLLSDDAISDDTEQQFRRARAEMERYLRSGEPWRFEQFLAEYPALVADEARAIGLAYAEFELRQQLGQHPDPTEWYERFPQWREQLRQLVAHGLLNGSSDGATTVGLESPTAAPETPLPRGKELRFGRYQVLAEVGRGGMGVVYQARDTVLGRLVALKTLRSGPLALAEEVERFYREARAEAQLHHPHIVEVLDIGQAGDDHYFAMAFATGGSLALCHDRFHAGPGRAVELLEKVARATQFAHDKGIIHRDLKPSNILLDEHGEPLVADFGLVRFLDSDVDLTRTGEPLGTPAYMAPEQADGRATAQSDVWALGVILYELLTGQRPFAGQACTEMSHHIRTADPPRPRVLRPGLDRGLETIALKCLEKDPARRYASAGALAEDLARWRRSEPITARPEGWPRRFWRGVRRRVRKATAALVFGCVLIAAAVAIYLAAMQRTDLRVERKDDPDQPIKDAQHQLAAGHAVTLIGETGPPRWSRSPTGKAVQSAGAARDYPFAMSSIEPALLELLPDPQLPRYRFRAEVRHDTGAGPGEVGIYFAYNSLVTAKGVEHRFWQLTFNDQQGAFPPVPGQGSEYEVALRCQRYRPAGEDPGAKIRIMPGPQKSFAPAVPPNGPAQTWRQLAVEVTPEKVWVFWEGEAIGCISGEQLRKVSREVLTNPRDPIDPPAGDAPGVALGLYVHRSTAAFRSVVIEPLEK
jgi:serine/threonine-protein kinase